MSTMQRMLTTHPDAADGVAQERLVACLEACLDCAAVCTACADACLAEESVDQLRSCISTDLTCADVCAATARVLTRRTGADAEVIEALVGACAVACRRCGDECALHASMHDHCRRCADSCRACEQACQALLDHLGGPSPA